MLDACCTAGGIWRGDAHRGLPAPYMLAILDVRTATISGKDRTNVERNKDAFDDDEDSADTGYSDYLDVWTNETWLRNVDEPWSAELILHYESDTDVMMLVGDVPLLNNNDPSKKWLLTI